MLLHIPDILTTEQLTSLRHALENADWTDGRETVGHQGAQVKYNEQLPDGSPLKAELGRVILDALARHPLYFSAALPRRTLSPRFNRYRGGGEYGFHIDGAVMLLGHHDEPGHAGDQTQDQAHSRNHHYVRSDISCTLFLSEPDEYDGGELIVSDTYGEHEVKLPAGDLVIYPSSSLHQVTPVTRGARLASFFWIQSLIRDDSQRRQLFEMDTAIERLRQSGADATALLQLTGVYHNLLRQWAEV
ncbi:MAG: Fe2+-dependent dioxygenase [Porticoccaceae bacterium]